MGNPDKYIRQEISGLINNMVVSTYTIPCFDTRVSGPTQPLYYVLMSTQTKELNQLSKCGGQWECTILLDLITRYEGPGNPGSRVLVNDMEEKVIELMVDFTMADLFLIRLENSQSFDNATDTENVFRQLMRYRIVINN